MRRSPDVSVSLQFISGLSRERLVYNLHHNFTSLLQCIYFWYFFALLSKALLDVVDGLQLKNTKNLFHHQVEWNFCTLCRTCKVSFQSVISEIYCLFYYALWGEMGRIVITSSTEFNTVWRCAMKISRIPRSLQWRMMPFTTFVSVIASRADVVSSSIRTYVCGLYSARARMIRCFWPPDSSLTISSLPAKSTDARFRDSYIRCSSYGSPKHTFYYMLIP